MIKLIIFDLDGVLVEAKEIHYKSLNLALGDKYKITIEEHLSTYDGLKTTEKLKLLTQKKNLPLELHANIWELKQKHTIELLKSLNPLENIVNCIKLLSKDGYKLAVCSNSIKETILTVLSRYGITKYFDVILSNEDVTNSKPHPEIFWKAMSLMNVLPEETLILEDSPYGLLSAL